MDLGKSAAGKQSKPSHFDAAARGATAKHRFITPEPGMSLQCLWCSRLYGGSFVAIAFFDRGATLRVLREAALADLPGAIARGRLLRVTNADVLYFSAILVLLPNLVFTAAFSPIAAVIVATGTGIAAYVFKSGLNFKPRSLLATPVDWQGLTACLIVGFGLCLLGGEYHVFFAGSDWFTRDFCLVRSCPQRRPRRLPLWRRGLSAARAPRHVFGSRSHRPGMGNSRTGISRFWCRIRYCLLSCCTCWPG